MLITKSCHQLMMSSKWELALKKRHKQDCMHQLIFGGAFKPTQYLGNVWLFPGLITTKKGRGKPRPLLALLCACEINWKLQTIYFSPAWHKPITCSMLFNTLCLSRGVAAWSSASHWDVQMNLVRVQLANNWNKLMTVLATQERDAQRHVSVTAVHHRGITEQQLIHANSVSLKFLLERRNWWCSPSRCSSQHGLNPELRWRPVVVARLLAWIVPDVYWH